ncbi:unnamed protein product [Ceratitis capitata]|uniref:(Mediterranean fruit fly) hypothetical protein n=1 Tax=Ceratitis capitata TaxID=7213 RepID=A0A811U308_CERCA|nr:unnamed protein product [Ceratitis capitata]
MPSLSLPLCNFLLNSSAHGWLKMTRRNASFTLTSVTLFFLKIPWRHITGGAGCEKLKVSNLNLIREIVLNKSDESSTI